MKHKRNHQILRKRKPKITAGERIIVEAPIPQLIAEYNLIQKKESKLSAHLRDVVEMRIDFLIEKGFIKTEGGRRSGMTNAIKKVLNDKK